MSRLKISQKLEKDIIDFGADYGIPADKIVQMLFDFAQYEDFYEFAYDNQDTYGFEYSVDEGSKTVGMVNKILEGADIRKTLSL